MTAAPPKPVTRQPVPWDPWCWLEVQIATATGTTGDPDRVGYWQADQPDTGDARYTTWVADSVVPPPAGQFPASGYGEWVQGNTGTKFSADWASISWRTVDCDLTSANFFTGGNPWDWNASPGNGTLRLNDPDHIYFPGGPGSGVFDDIGVNTPIRVIAHLTANFDQTPANAAKRLADRTLITGLIRSIDHELTPVGTGVTTIHFSEPHVLYGRVNRPASPLPNFEHTTQRFQTIHNMSDDPGTGLMQHPVVMDDHGGDTANWTNTIYYQADDVAGDLWTELAKVGNGAGYVMALRLWDASNYAPYATNGNPRVGALVPTYPKELGVGVSDRSYGFDTRTLAADCSPKNATFNYTYTHSGSRAKLSLCPVGSIQFGHDDSDLANSISIAPMNGTEVVKVDQASIDRFYRHTFQRHDFTFQTDYTDEVARRYISRLSHAIYHISDCDFTIDEPRDFEFALGAVPTSLVKMDHPPVEPGRWMKLAWGWLGADLRVTRVAHDITPAGWTVTHSYEVHNPTSAGEGESTWDDAVWDRNLWET